MSPVSDVSNAYLEQDDITTAAPESSGVVFTLAHHPCISTESLPNDTLGSASSLEYPDTSGPTSNSGVPRFSTSPSAMSKSGPPESSTKYFSSRESTLQLRCHSNQPSPNLEVQISPPVIESNYQRCEAGQLSSHKHRVSCRQFGDPGCDREFKDWRTRERHRKSCREANPGSKIRLWSCRCSETFKRWDGFLRHHRTCKRAVRQPYTCQCGDEFDDWHEFDRHHQSELGKKGRPRKANGTDGC